MTTRPGRQPVRLTVAGGAAVMALLLTVCAAYGQDPTAGSTSTAPAEKQAPTPAVQSDPQAADPTAGTQLVDVFDLLRKIRRKELTPEQQAAAHD